MKKGPLFYFLFLLVTTSMTCNKYKAGEFVNTQFVSEDRSKLLYNYYYPEGDHQDGSLPVFLFLHGAGERGNDNKAQLKHVIHRFGEASFQSKHPCIIIVPQCPTGDYWAPVDRENRQWDRYLSSEPTTSMRVLIELMEELRTKKIVDTTRVYISGLSMGGFGCFDFLSRYPQWFAAAVPICGGADLSKVDQFKDIPMRIFHGAKDPVIPVQLSRTIFASLNAKGAPVEYTEYPEGDHLIWDAAYEGEQLIEWLFSQGRG